MNNTTKRTINSFRASDVNRWATIQHPTMGRLDGIINGFSLDNRSRVRGYLNFSIYIPNLNQIYELLVYNLVEIRNYVVPQ